MGTIQSLAASVVGNCLLRQNTITNAANNSPAHIIFANSIPGVPLGTAPSVL
jgi:hypothetical protein